MKSVHLSFRQILIMLFACSPAVIAQTSSQAVILQYHHISTATPAVTSVSTDEFQQHMSYLRDNGFQILPLQEVVQKLQNAEALPERTVVITFDDAYISVYEVAFPLLKDHAWPFTIFVSTGLVGTNTSLYTDWDQLREMADAGATIANHTVSHPYLLNSDATESKRQWLQTVAEEISQAEARITKETGQNHHLLAYPYGEYNPEIQDLVAELGFTGIGQHSGPANSSSDFTALPRFSFSGIYASMDGFQGKVNSLAFDIRSISPASPMTSSTMPSVEISFNPGDYSLGQLSCYNNGTAIEVTQKPESDLTYLVQTTIENHSRRFRYNCTAPASNGRYYWVSIPWINMDVAD